MRHLASLLLPLALVACGTDDATTDPTEPPLLAFGSSTSTITLAWSLPSAAGFTLERKSGAGDYAPLATLPAEAAGYLDTGLAAGVYTYRLRVTGDAGPGLERSASPSDEVALVTADEPLQGEPVQAVVGAAGGSLTVDGAMVTFAPGSVPDGTGVALQRFVSPMGGDPGVEVAVDALAGPLQIAFPYGADDEPGNLSIVRKQVDGTWVAQPFELDPVGRTLTLAVTPDAAAAKRPAASGARVRALVLRARAIEPRRAVVPPGATITLIAYAFFSDFVCDRGDLASSVGCQMIALALDPRQLLRPVRQSRVTYANVVAGYERDWLVQGVFGGDPSVGRIVPRPIGADYLAPAVRPGTNPVDVTFTSVRVDGATRTPEPPLHASITIANPRWRGSLACVIEASRTEPLPTGRKVTTLASRVAATAEDALVPSAFSMTITSAQASYTRTVTTDEEVGTVLCPVHFHSVYLATKTIAAPDPSDLVALVVDDTRGEFMLTSGFGANLRAPATLTNTYTATGDPSRCPPPPNAVIPSEFQPFWSCGGLGTFPVGSDAIDVDTTVHDQADPPGTTHYTFHFTRQ